MIGPVPIATDIIGNVKRGFSQLLRDRGWGTMLAFFVCLMLLVQMLFLFSLSVRTVSGLLADSAAIQLQVLPTANEANIQQLYAALHAHPAVRSVTFLSKQQVYEQQKQLHPDDIAFLEQYNFSNPFPDVFSVTLVSLAAYDQFTNDIRSDRWKSVVDPSSLAASVDSEAHLRTLLDVTGSVYLLSILLTIIGYVVLACAVLAWSKRTADRRGEESSVRHLMGASSMQVLLPFATEMSILLVAAIVIAAVIIVAFILLLPVLLPSTAAETSFQAFRSAFVPLLWTVFPLFILAEILCAPLLAYAGTTVIVRRILPKSFILFS